MKINSGLFCRWLACLSVLIAIGCGRAEPNKPSATVAVPNDVPVAELVSVPFAAAPASDHPTLFKRLDASSIGVNFVHQWSPPDDFFMEIRSYACTAGVAVGDYDSDGRPDIFLASQTDGGRLYRNLGDWKFKDVTVAAGLKLKGMWATGVSFVDVNNDTRLDIALCGFNCQNRVFINQGDGTFDDRSTELGLNYEGASTMMSFADYDRDGDLDLYLLTNRLPPKKRQTGRATKVDGQVVVPDHMLEEIGVMNLPGGEFQFLPAGQFDYLLRNDGEKFTDVTVKAGMAKRNHHGLSATWWDPNDDGWPDLYVANDFAWPDHLYVNRGTSEAPWFKDVVRSAMPHIPWFSMGSDIGDFNNDGRVDLIATDMSPTSHYRSKLTMGDMSTFGWFLEKADPRQYMRNAMLINNGTGRFQEVAQMAGVASSDWTWSVRAEDFDNDGNVDLFMSTGMSRDFENADLSEQLKQLQKSAASDQEKAKIAAEFWRDKPVQQEPNIAFRNLGELRFENVAAAWGLDEKSVGFGCATGDFDGDGDLDIIVNNFLSPPSIYRNLVAEKNGESFHGLKLKLRGRQSNSFGIGARVELTTETRQQVRYVTLARGYMSSSENAICFGLGDSEHVASLRVVWPSGREQEFTDLATNQELTVTEPDSSTSSQVVDDVDATPTKPWFARSDATRRMRHGERPFDDFERQPLLPNRLSQLGPALALADINGDGVEDLFIGGAAGEPGRPYLWEDGAFNVEAKQIPAFIADLEHEDMGALFFDADLDGDVDLYVVSGGVECEPDASVLQDRLYLNDGAGRFSRAADAALPEMRFSGSCVCGADYDRDGDVDLFVGGRSVPGQYPTSPSSCLLENRSEAGVPKFVDATAARCPALKESGMVTSAIWSDVNGDRWLDLLVTYEWGPVKLWLNQQGDLVDATSDAGLAERRGWFNGITGGDVDRDGDIDFVVTNFGQNTKYHASTAKPIEIYFGEFDDSGKRRIIEAVHKGDRLLPVRGKSCSQNAMPFLRTQFPTYHDFALQSLSGLYPQDRLDEALRLEVNELDSGVLLNDGDGKFQWRPLPRIAQISPGFGVRLADFDLDGQLDLLLAQNFFGPQRETGRMNAGVGQLLFGLGDGRFKIVGPRESGIVIPGDSKALALADLNADLRPDVVISTNDGPVRSFLNQASDDRPLLCVRLTGEVGNRDAFGARIEVVGADSSRQVAEVYGGDSYLSQSIAQQTFAVDPTQVSEVRVAWPDGTESSVPVSGKTDLIEIKKP